MSVQNSRIAIASTLCVMASLVCFSASLATSALFNSPGVLAIGAFAGMAAGAAAILLGFGGLAHIGFSRGQRTGYAYAAIGAGFPSAGLLVIFLLISATGVKEKAYRARCEENLSAIGKAMLAYANDHDGLLPVAGGRDTRWGGALKDWTTVERRDAFGLAPNGTGGEATIGSSLYLLIRYKYGDVTPRTFLCKGDKAAKEFNPAKYNLKDRDFSDFWDFGPDPGKHISYAYQMVYSWPPLTLKAGSEAWDFAIAADRNPWMTEKRAEDFSQFQPDWKLFTGTAEQARVGNAVAHESYGQNVLFLDNHVEFECRPFCGLDDDNIYTSWDGRDKARGAPPKLGSVPAEAKDSLLVNDPVLPAK